MGNTNPQMARIMEIYPQIAQMSGNLRQSIVICGICGPESAD